MKWKFRALAAMGITTLCFTGFALYSFYYHTPEVTSGSLNASLETEGRMDTTPSQGDPIGNYDLSAHQTLSRVVLLIRENYVEPERIAPYDMFIAALDSIQKTVPEVMVDDSRAPQKITVSVGSSSQTFELGKLDQLWEVTMALRDIFRFLQGKISDSEQRREIEYAAVNGMLSTLDPHSILLKPESFDEVKTSTKGEFGGLGIVISMRDGALTVISPIEGTPAARAGLKTQDKVVKINEESTVGMNLEEAVQRLRGKPGSQVSIWILRQNWTEARRFVLTRAIIKIKSVTSTLLEDKVGYLKVKSFQNNTYDDLNSHLQALHREAGGRLKGLILDLRNNPGGLLDQAILISDRFIAQGPLVITVGEGNRRRDVKQAHAAGTESDYPIAVLVNGGSASASEIVSGALKNHNRAVVIGSSTFGKGSVQVLYDFKDKSALKLTIAQYLTPGDISIQSVGIAPDIEVVPARISKDELHLFAHDDSPREKDLSKHLTQYHTTQPVDQSPAMRLVHLVAANDDTEGDANGGGDDKRSVAAQENAASDKFVYDTETRLARELLAKATSTDRRDVIAHAATLFDKRSMEEEGRIVQRFQSLGVDWNKFDTAVRSTPSSELAVTLETPDQPIKAGQTLTMTARVRNTGKVPLSRLFGVTASDNPMLKNREFVFGKLLPGESRSWQVEIKLPKDLHARADQVTLNVGSRTQPSLDAKAIAFVRMEELPQPRFAYTYRLIEEGTSQGDGVLQAGEKVKLRLRVQNMGPGAAQDTTVSVKNMSGASVFLDRGRQKLGDLPVGAVKETELSFRLRAPQANEPATESVKLKVMMWDGVVGAANTDVITLPVLPERRGRSAVQAVVAPDQELPLYAGADARMPVLGYIPTNTPVQSDWMLGDWLRIVQGKGVSGYVHVTDARTQVTQGRKIVAANGRDKSKSALKADLSKEIRWTQGRSSPNIMMDAKQLITLQDLYSLAGVVQDDTQLKDVFVFVNDKKVYYRALGVRAKDSAGISAPIDVKVPLKAGSNTIAVVVRENDDVIARKIFSVFRDGGPAATVATSAAP